MAPEFGICPLCSQFVAATVDHYLLQKHFPSFNLTPVSLIRACLGCNKRKLAMVAGRADDHYLATVGKNTVNTAPPPRASVTDIHPW